MKILFVISSLSSGGAERVLSILTNEFYNRKYETSVILICKQEVFYVLNDGIKIIQLDLCGSSKNIFVALNRNLKIIKSLHKVFNEEKPDVIVSFLSRTNIYTLMAQYGKKFKTIISEHTDNSMLQKNRFFDFLRRIMYEKADALVSVSKGADRYFNFLSKNKRHVIYNPLEKDIVEKSEVFMGGLPKKYIIAVGRLGREKGYEKMLEAFIKSKITDLDFLIFGEGRLEKDLKKYIRDNKLENQVKLMGTVKNIYPYMKNAYFLVLSSEREGFPNVLIESMACGCPVVSFDCPSGPSEIITDGINGILVENQNIQKLSLAMQKLIDNKNLRENMSKNAKEVYEIYNVEKIVDQWEELICKTTK